MHILTSSIVSRIKNQDSRINNQESRFNNQDSRDKRPSATVSFGEGGKSQITISMNPILIGNTVAQNPQKEQKRSFQPT
jgi:hypothetical protein